MALRLGAMGSPMTDNSIYQIVGRRPRVAITDLGDLRPLPLGPPGVHRRTMLWVTLGSGFTIGLGLGVWLGIWSGGRNSRG